MPPLSLNIIWSKEVHHVSQRSSICKDRKEHQICGSAVGRPYELVPELERRQPASQGPFSRRHICRGCADCDTRFYLRNQSQLTVINLSPPSSLSMPFFFLFPKRERDTFEFKKITTMASSGRDDRNILEEPTIDYSEWRCFYDDGFVYRTPGFQVRDFQSYPGGPSVIDPERFRTMFDIMVTHPCWSYILLICLIGQFFLVFVTLFFVFDEYTGLGRGSIFLTFSSLLLDFSQLLQSWNDT